MKEKKTTPLRERMIEDMRIRGMSPKTQQGHHLTLGQKAGANKTLATGFINLLSCRSERESIIPPVS